MKYVAIQSFATGSCWVKCFCPFDSLEEAKKAIEENVGNSYTGEIMVMNDFIKIK